MSDSAVPPPPLLARDDDEDLDDNVENNYQSTGESFGDLPPTYGDDNNVNNARYADELDYDAPTRDDGGDSDLSDLEEVDLNALPARSTTAPGGAAAGDDDDDGFEDRSAAIPARRAPPTTAGPRGSSKQDEDDDQDEDDYGGEDLGDGRRKRRRGGAGAGRKRRGDGAAGAGGDGEDGGGAAAPKIKRSKLDAALVGLDEETKNRVLQMQRTADAASRGPSRRRARDIDVKEFDLQARHFCDQLIRASNQDRDAHAAGKPALGKLRMLPKLKLELDKADMVSQWLDAQVLSVFLEWLTPFTTDGALPAHEVRRELFRYLVAMPISSDHLLEVKIGPLVVFYSKYPKETMEIRKMAQECYQKWSRPILGLSDSYRNSRVQNAEDALESAGRGGSTQFSVRPKSGVPASQSRTSQSALAAVSQSQRQQYHSQEDPSQQQQEGGLAQRLRLPPTRHVGFTIRPESRVPAGGSAGDGKGGRRGASARK